MDALGDDTYYALSLPPMVATPASSRYFAYVGYLAQ